MNDTNPADPRDIPQSTVEEFQRDGCAILRGVFTPWLEGLREGIEENIANPSFRERTYHPEDGSAAFFQDFCNWDRIAGYRALARESGGFCEVALSTDVWFWRFPVTSLKPD